MATVKKTIFPFFSLKVSIIALVLGQNYVVSATAEFKCQSEVHYRWERSEPTAAPGKVALTPTPAAEGDEKKDEGTKKDDKANEVFWITTAAVGATEAEAKEKIKAPVAEQRSAADQSCRELHENQAKCLSVKYSQNQATWQLMGFSQRKEFEKKMVQDCEQASGRCLGSAATEPVCQEIVVADATAAAGADASKGKDAKKK